MGPGKVQTSRVPVPGVEPGVGRGMTAVATGPGGLETTPIDWNIRPAGTVSVMVTPDAALSGTLR